MANMSSFEIRLEILKMAKELVMDKHYLERERVSMTWQMQCDEAQRDGTRIPTLPVVSFPSEQEIIEKADILNDFISSRKQ